MKLKDAAEMQEVLTPTRGKTSGFGFEMTYRSCGFGGKKKKDYRG